jgi:hypothetical protein
MRRLGLGSGSLRSIRKKEMVGMKNNRSQVGAIGVGLIIGLAILAVLLFAGLSLYGYATSIQREGLSWETDLNETTRVEVSERATYETGILEQTGLANLKSEKVNQVIRGALEGRFGEDGFKGGSFAAAITEAYPDLKSLDIYDKISPAIQAGREAIRNKQNLRIEKAQKYNFWRKEGLVRPKVLAWAGYPSENLTFKVGDRMYKAAEALEKMAEPISTANVNRSFESGVEQPINFK